MRNIVLIEERPVVCGLEPELTQCFTLGVRAYDAVHANEAGEADAVKAFGVEDGRGVADTLGKICRHR